MPSLQYLRERSLSINDSPHEEIELIQNVLNTCDRTSLIVKKLLLFSDDSDVIFEDVYVSKIINEAMQEIQPLLRNAFRLETYLPDGDLILNLDRKSIKQVIIDLILNAYDALLPEGIITIRA